MGVNGLWKLLLPIGRRISIETLTGKTLAIDASIWLTQFVKAIRNNNNSSSSLSQDLDLLLGVNGEKGGAHHPSAHLIGFFRRLCKLLFHGIKPVIVFDGETPEIKRAEILKRREQREKGYTGGVGEGPLDDEAMKRLAKRILLSQINNNSKKTAEDDSGHQPEDQDRQQQNNDESQNKSSSDSNNIINQPEADECSIFTDDMSDSDQDTDNTNDDDQNNENSLSKDDEDDNVLLESTNLSKLSKENNIKTRELQMLTTKERTDVFEKALCKRRMKSRKEFMPVAGNPDGFSSCQLSNFLKQSMLNKNISHVTDTLKKKQEEEQLVLQDDEESHDENENNDDTEEAKGGFIMATSESEDENNDSSGENTKKLSETSHYEAESDHAHHDTEESSDDENNMEEKVEIKFQENNEIEAKFRSRYEEEQDKINKERGEFLSNKLPEVQEVNDSSSDSGEEGAKKNLNSLSAFLKQFNDGEDSDDDSNNSDGLECENDNSSCGMSVNWEDGDETNNEERENESGQENVIERLEESEQEEEYEEIPSPVQVNTPSCGGRDLGIHTRQQSELEELEEEVTVSSTSHKSGWEKLRPLSIEQEQSSDEDKISDSNESDDKQHVEPKPVNENDKAQPKIASESNPIQEIHISDNKDDVDIIDLDGDSDSDLEPHDKQTKASLPSTTVETNDKKEESFDDIICIDESPSRKSPQKSVSPGIEKNPKKHAKALEQAQRTASNLTDWAGRAVRRAFKDMNSNAGLDKNDENEFNDTADGTQSLESLSESDSENDLIEELKSPTKSNEKQDIVEQVIPSPQNNGGNKESTESGGGGVTSFQYESLSEFQSEQNKMMEKMKRQKQDMDSYVTDEMKQEVIQLLELLGIPYVLSPSEAEAQCATLEQLGLVDGIVTEDSDTFVFGGKNVYKNIFDSQKYVEVYKAEDACREFSLTHESFIALAMLLGGDYTEGVKGVGIVNGMEVLFAYPPEKHKPDENQDKDLENHSVFLALQQFKEWLDGFDTNNLNLSNQQATSSVDDNDDENNNNKTELQKRRKDFQIKHKTARTRWIPPQNFPSKKVLNAYCNPVVDQSSTKFSWGTPDVENIHKFCKQNVVGWSEEDVDKYLTPVIKAIEERKVTGVQTRIDSYFMGYNDNIKIAHIRSKRLQTVLNDMNNSKKDESSSGASDERQKKRRRRK